MTFWFGALAARNHLRPWLSHGISIGAIVILFLGVAGRDLYQTGAERFRDIADAQRQVENLAWSTAQNATDAFRQADLGVAGLVDLIEIDGAGPVQIERLRQLIRRRLKSSPILQGVAYYDANGDVVANGLPVTLPLNVADRRYFQYHVTNPDPGPYTSELLRSRFSNKQVVTVSRRVNHADGSFAGVVSAAIGFDYLQNYYATLQLGRQGVVSLLRDDGTLLVRQPYREAAVGTNLGTNPDYHQVLETLAGGTVEFDSPVDGVLRIYGYHRVTGFPLLAVAALGVNEELERWRTRTLEHVLTTSAIALILGFFVFRLTRQILLLARSERKAAAANAELGEAAQRLAEARDQSDKASEAKSRFLTGITHELRTPLHGIIGYAELLRLEGGLNPCQSHRVAAMIAAGEHLLALINAVLDVSQIEADRLDLHPIDIEMPDFARSCLNVVRPAAEAKGLGLILTVAEPLRARADPTRLRQVVLNLLGNAIKFTPAGAVELRLKKVPEIAAIRLEVADTGPGIKARHRDKLFRAFERLNAEALWGIEGAGLGLALAAGLVRAMDGEIGFADNPDGGSVFWLELPVGDASAITAATADPPHRSASPSRRVLVVDDDPLNRDIASGFLRPCGHDVVCLDSGAAAVAAAATEDFDVILMDVRMPGMNGLEATRRIRALRGPRGKVPVVAVTAQAFAEQIEICRQAGMDTHVAKPFRQAELLATIDGVAAAADAAAATTDGIRGTAPATSADAAEAEIPLFDRARFADIAESLRSEDVAEHLRTLIARSETLLRELRAPNMSGPAVALVEAVHRLAGGAGAYGFMALSQAARRFEFAAQVGSAAQSQALAQQLAAAIETTCLILQQELAEMTDLAR